jgi:hypothetical protein
MILCVRSAARDAIEDRRQHALHALHITLVIEKGNTWTQNEDGFFSVKNCFRFRVRVCTTCTDSITDANLEAFAKEGEGDGGLPSTVKQPI